MSFNILYYPVRSILFLSIWFDFTFRYHFFRISQYITTGTIEYKLRKFAEKSEKCFVRDYQTTNSVFRQLILDDFEGVFVVLMSGCAISLFFFITELIIRYEYVMRNFFLLLLTAFHRKIEALVIKLKHFSSCIWLKMKDFFKWSFWRFI